MREKRGSDQYCAVPLIARGIFDLSAMIQLDIDGALTHREECRISRSLQMTSEARRRFLNHQIILGMGTWRQIGQLPTQDRYAGARPTPDFLRPRGQNLCERTTGGHCIPDQRRQKNPSASHLRKSIHVVQLIYENQVQFLVVFFEENQLVQY